MNGPKTFPSFEELLARTIEHNPTRTEASLRRGILHNALQHEDGSWVWRYRRFDGEMTTGLQPSERDDVGGNGLWDVVGGTTVPLMLVRGLLKQSVVDDADEDELIRRKPDARIVHISNAGHSIQGDTPRELAIILDEFAVPASTGVRVSVDAERCQGHMACAIAAPDVFGSDDYGNAIVLIDGEVPAHQVVRVRRAEGNCPERAIIVEERK